MSSAKLPLAYRWFLNKGLSNWEPWYFMESAGATTVDIDASQDAAMARQFMVESGAEDFGVHLFARRQDCDDFAFFVVKDRVIEDRTITFHLSFAKKLELKSPLLYANLQSRPFIEWLRDTALPDVADWMNEGDMSDD
jgi:hypothetical protein